MRAKGSLRGLGARVGALLWLLALYVGLTYLAVGTISVSQINTRFGDQAGYIFHIAGIADQQRRVRSTQVEDADQLAYRSRLQRDAALVEVNAQAQRLGISMSAVRAALDDPKASVRLRDFAVEADGDTNKAWDNAVSEYYRQSLMSGLATERRDKLVEELRDGLSKLTDSQVIDGKVLGGISQSLFQTATSTVAGLRSFGYAWLFSIPSEVLTLVLALVLGALGSALHMTKVVIDSGERPPGLWYLFRPCQGVLMALVVFVLLKAGQLTVGAGDTDTLNPYFVAFIGTISGLLSPDAYRLVQRAGAALIPAGDDMSDRWAFGLAVAMNAAGLDAETLAQGVGVRVDELNAWMAETAPVPAAQQRLLAAWLHADARQLFTADRPPPRRSITAATPVPAE
ncbi:MAG: hypothetical protein ACM31D_01305 [Bacteroidota bacterium]